MALRLIKKAVKEEMPVFDRKALNQALMTLDGEPVAILRMAVSQQMDDRNAVNLTEP